MAGAHPRSIRTLIRRLCNSRENSVVSFNHIYHTPHIDSLTHTQALVSLILGKSFYANYCWCFTINICGGGPHFIFVTCIPHHLFRYAKQILPTVNNKYSHRVEWKKIFVYIYLKTVVQTCQKLCEHFFFFLLFYSLLLPVVYSTR